MDVEVRKAYRTLQRAGITTMCPDSSLEDFPKEYGIFLLQWIRNQNIPCSVLRVASNKGRYSNLSSAMDKAARAFLKEHCQAEVKVNDHYQFRSDSFYQASMKTEADDTKIMTTYLSHLSPKDAVKKIASANDRVLGIFPGFSKGNQPFLIFFVMDDDELIDVHGYLYFYTVLSDEEIAKAEETRKKREEAAAKTVEKRQKAKETKDKKTLQQLLAKYGDNRGT